MHIYRGTLELMDYVFFATVERGKVYETGAFIHNYALTYAFRLANAPYSHQTQKPNYTRELGLPNEWGVYLTPAGPERFSHRLVQWNTIQESYGLAGKARSIGYPDWGFARVLRPESIFTFYALVDDPARVPAGMTVFHDALAGRTVRIRLGKFIGKTRLRLEQATKVERTEGDFTVRTLLNWRDLTADPLVCDVLAASLPTRLVSNALFTKTPYYGVHFGEDGEVNLPIGMRFLARPPEEKKQR